MIHRALLASAAALSLLAGCAAENEPDALPPAPSPSAGEHGARAGAEEVGEPHNALLTVSPRGEAALIDLATETEHPIGTIGAPEALASDGRYAFVTTPQGVEVIDGGAWTWDHGDHFHFYRATPSLRGTVEGQGPVEVVTPPLSTRGAAGFFFSDGTAVAIDMASLDAGNVSEWFRIDTGDPSGIVAPVGEYAIVAAGAEARVYASDGKPDGDPVACDAPAGAISTRVGTVIGCADGALLATADASSVEIERIPAPEGFPRADAFAGRKGRPTVAALSGSMAFWLLDTRERAWKHVEVEAPIRSVASADDAEENVLAIGDDDRVRVFGPDGENRGITAPIADDASSLVVDAQRAYLTAPESGLVYEIDYRDGARIARQFAPAAGLAVGTEVGR